MGFVSVSAREGHDGKLLAIAFAGSGLLLSRGRANSTQLRELVLAVGGAAWAAAGKPHIFGRDMSERGTCSFLVP